VSVDVGLTVAEHAEWDLEAGFWLLFFFVLVFRVMRSLLEFAAICRRLLALSGWWSEFQVSQPLSVDLNVVFLEWRRAVMLSRLNAAMENECG